MINFLIKDLIKKIEDSVNKKEQHFDCLVEALQGACILEFATIPPYLCALWSVKDENHPVAKAIRAVLQEEMLHMAFVCNMLTAIGESPNKVDSLNYPSKLPLGVHPNLTVGLSGVSEKTLHDFMQIELPDVVTKVSGEDFDCEKHHTNTIGELYDKIHEMFIELNPEIKPDHQLTGPLSWFVMNDVKAVGEAIEIIKVQGEGAADSVYKKVSDLPHFYSFWEVLKGREIAVDGKELVWGEPIQPEYNLAQSAENKDFWPMAEVPVGGYKKKDVSAEVWQLLSDFDDAYTKLIDMLHLAWNGGGQEYLIHAIEIMFSLQNYALPLMQIPIPGGEGNYGPHFRYKSKRSK